MGDSSEQVLPSPALSKARGHLQREAISREALGALADRPAGFDAVAVLQEQDRLRDPRLVPLRYERMAASPLGFYRGAAAVMASDLAAGSSSELWVQLCGDAHLMNFGVFRSPEARLLFDVDDFDETRPGPFDWDVKRLAASIAVAGSQIGCTRRQQERAVLEAVGRYRSAMRAFAERPTLAVWTARLEVRRVARRLVGALGDPYSLRAGSVLVDEKRRSNRTAYERLVSSTPSGPRIVSSPPLVVPLCDLPAGEGGEDTYRFLMEVLHGYESSLATGRRHLLRQFSPIDAARKVVGVGSVGLRCFVVLLLGRDATDPFFLQVKEAVPSVLERHLGPSTAGSPGQRVVEGQELLQADPDAFLGHLDVDDGGSRRSYYVRQLYDGKAAADPTRFDADLLTGYGALCGWTLARAHARSGDRIALAAYLGKGSAFDEAIAAFALGYVSRNAADHAALKASIAKGRVDATTT